jgi:UDPglucose 6-dehydrogenase
MRSHTSGGTEHARLFKRNYITQRLLEEHADVVITDPKALENAKQDMGGAPKNIVYETDPYMAAKDAHAIAVVTEWDLYKELDYEKIYQHMIKPAFIFDSRNILDHQKLFEIGFNVYPIGKTPLSHL